jgi:hypothetical protein
MIETPPSQPTNRVRMRVLTSLTKKEAASLQRAGREFGQEGGT